MTANVVAFMNQKGGVGKTTSVASVGSLLADDHGLRVLLVDLDPQGNLSDHFGVDPNVTETSVYNLLMDGTPAAELIHHVHGLDLLPANLDLSGAEIELAGMMMRELRLKNALVPLLPDYDFILLDCPPSLGLLTVSGLALAGSVVVPMEAEYLALRGLSQLMQTVDVVRQHLNPTLEVAAVLFCRYSPQTNLARDVRAEVERFFPGRVLKTAIRRNVRLAEAPSHGLPVTRYDPTCSGAEDYRMAVKELLERFPRPAAERPASSRRPAVVAVEAVEAVAVMETADDAARTARERLDPPRPPMAGAPEAGERRTAANVPPDGDEPGVAERDRRLGRGVDDWRRRPIWRADSSPELETLPLPDVDKAPPGPGNDNA